MAALNTFQKISTLLPTVKYRVKDGSAMEATYIVEIANQVMKNVYDEELWDLMRVHYFKQGTLTILTKSSVVSHAAKMNERKFCESVQRQTGTVIQGIVCRVG